MVAAKLKLLLIYFISKIKHFPMPISYRFLLIFSKLTQNCVKSKLSKKGYYRISDYLEF